MRRGGCGAPENALILHGAVRGSIPHHERNLAANGTSPRTEIDCSPFQGAACRTICVISDGRPRRIASPAHRPVPLETYRRIAPTRYRPDTKPLLAQRVSRPGPRIWPPWVWPDNSSMARSEERRVGKEGGARGR